MLHNARAMCPMLMWARKGWVHNHHSLQETAMWLWMVCHWYVVKTLEMNSLKCIPFCHRWAYITSVDIKEPISISTTLHNLLEIPFMKWIISPKPVRSCRWGKVLLSQTDTFQWSCATDLILLKSWLWWRLKSLYYLTSLTLRWNDNIHNFHKWIKGQQDGFSPNQSIKLQG